MRVVVVGAGDVGTVVAQRLAENHEITVVDTDATRTDALADSLSVETVTGDGRSMAVLERAGVAEADVLVASTDDDATNVMLCGAAKHTTDAFTLARVRRADLHRSWRETGDTFGVDRMLSVDRLTAEKLVRTVALPGARAAESFEDGAVVLAEFDIDPDGPITGERIADADRFPSLTFAAVFRDGAVVIADGETRIEAGDRLAVIGSPTSVQRFGETLSSASALDPESRVVIVGGGRAGSAIAEVFLESGYTPRVIERDGERAAELEADLGIDVITGDGTDPAVLEEAGVAEAALLVAAVNDQHNYLACALAGEGARTASLVSDSEQEPLFDTVGVDITVHPRTVIAEALAEIVLGEHANEVALLEGDSAEVLEVTVDHDSVLAGATIEDAARELPEGFVVGAIVRGGSFHTPRGGTVIQVGDHVTACVDSAVADEIAARL